MKKLVYNIVIYHTNTVKSVYTEHKGETIHRMYRNHDYFGDGSVHNTWRPLTIQTI